VKFITLLNAIEKRPCDVWIMWCWNAKASLFLKKITVVLSHEHADVGNRPET